MGFLHKNITVGSPITIALKKLACDQFIFAPCIIASLLTIFNAMQGLTLEENMKKFKKEYPVVLSTSYILWPWVQMFNLRFVPLHFQIFVIQITSLIWNIYLSWKTNQNCGTNLKNKNEDNEIYMYCNKSLLDKNKK